jgi:peroxiredoxin
VQLQSYADQFADAGIGIVVITYDSPELQQVFIDRFNITFPLLSDIDASSVKSLGLLNEEYAPSDSVYGIPHPGILVLDTKQYVVGKIFLEAYEKRVEAAGVLDLAVRALNAS